MNVFINANELEALCGLPHWQQLTYLRGIRPYMDVKTSITGIKRRISHQSIAEQLYVEPHPGIKSESFSRAQVRRAIASLERVGVISNLSKDKQLILKCELASEHYFAQNKAVTNPSHKTVTKPSQQNQAITGFAENKRVKADITTTPKADTPLKEDNYIYLLRRFDQFWRMYPEKKSRERAFEAFKQINPDDNLLRSILHALENQVKATKTKQSRGEWVPAWKYPANWLTQESWKDEINTEVAQEKKHAKASNPNSKQTATSGFYIPDESEGFEQQGTILEFKKR